MSEGRIIEYIDQGKFICTLCLQDKGNRLHLLTPHNREVNLSNKRTILSSDTVIDPSKPREELLEILRRIEETRDRLKSQVDVRYLWELTKDENQGFTHAYLAELVFGENVRDDHLSALVRALFEDQFYFKYKDGRFLPHPEERVEQIIRQREEESLREERLAQGSVWIKRILAGVATEPPPCSDFVVDLLVQVALYGNEAEDFKYGKELLARADIKDLRKARDLLIALGVWEEDENLDILRSNIERDFSSDQLAAAAALAQASASTMGRLDLSELQTLTIDGALTLDFDDALSLEKRDGVFELGIHIADVAAMIEPETILDRAAAERASSLYLPRRQIPMLPPGLSHNTLSLKEGCRRQALSLIARLDEDGTLLDYAFRPSIINVHRRLTYEQVNADLAGDQRLQNLLYISRRLREFRNARGALNLSLPEIEVEFTPGGEIQLSLVDQDTPSHLIVSELMILYNWLAAKFCLENQIPVLYRTQTEPGEIISLDEKGYFFYVFLQRRKLSPLQIQSNVKPHCGLGVDAYVQATSPIRRYLDLVVQRQISAFLRELPPPYDVKKLEEIRLANEPLLRELNKIKRYRLRYWILKFLSQHKDRVYKAMVLDELKSKCRVVLRDTYLFAEIKKTDGKTFGPGQDIMVQVRKADPWEDTLELSVADI